jgi:transcriptional regulator with XRE-family HTH domain
MPRKRHTPREIAAKLTQATELAAQGKLQSEIARTLGVSVMTLHRWRKGSPAVAHVPAAVVLTEEGSRRAAIAELQLENSLLRRLVIDLLLEKMRLEEEEERGTGERAEKPARVPPQAA